LEAPRLRGWIHLVAFVASVLAGGALIGAAIVVGHASIAWPVAVYAVGLCALLGTSALYHRRRWTSDRSRDLMRRIDHAVIFLFIACTYTPFLVVALPDGSGGPLLAIVWGGAVLGAVMEFVRPAGRRWLRVPLYLALGWVALPMIGALGDALGLLPIVLLAAGGLLYTIGAAFYAAGWPNPWPRTFGHHEFFHGATVAAAACHAVAVWVVVLARA
jgi:hemolysin III